MGKVASGTVHLVAVHYRTENFSSERPIGFRLLNIDDKRVGDFAYEKVFALLASNANDIEGLCIDNGVIAGSNGVLTRYAKVVGNRTYDKSTVVILSSISDGFGYEVYSNDIGYKKLSGADTLKLCKSCGIANGKIVPNGSSEFLSSISGEYLESSIKVGGQAKAVNKEISKTVNNNIAPKIAPAPVIETPSVTSNTPVTHNGAVANSNKPKEDIKAKLEERFGVKIDANKSANGLRILGKHESHIGQNVRQIVGGLPGHVVVLGPEDETPKDASGNEYPTLSVDELFAAGISLLKEVRPFYYSALRIIPRHEDSDEETMGVSDSDFYYNPYFAASLTLPEFEFLLLHEVSHIAMRHGLRKGSRNPVLWNVACDLFINKVLCEEFNVNPHTDESTKPSSGFTFEKFGVTYTSKFAIMFPAIGGCYEDWVDTKNDTVESIYDKLENMDPEKLKQITDKLRDMINKLNSQNGQQGGQGGPGGQGGQGIPGGQGGQGDNESGQDGSQSGPSGQGGSQSGQGNQQGNQQGQGNQSGQGNQQGNQPGQGGNQSGQDDDCGIDISKALDICKDKKGMSQTEEKNKADQKQLLNKITTLTEKTVKESGITAGSGRGSSGVVEQWVADDLIPRIDWRKYVKNYLQKMFTEERSLRHPNKRYIWNNTYLPSKNTEENKLEGIKMCIDTSGSMSDTDVAIAMGEVRSLTKKFPCTVDVVYWDDGIQSIQTFKDAKPTDFKKYSATGRGGTNPIHIFEEFNKKEYWSGKKTKPSVIMVLTDGYFSTNPEPYKQFKKHFNKNVIWILIAKNSVSIKDFEPPLGVVANIKNVD